MDTETLVIRGKRILVTPYILPHISKMTEEEKEPTWRQRWNSQTAGLLCISKQAASNLGERGSV